MSQCWLLPVGLSAELVKVITGLDVLLGCSWCSSEVDEPDVWISFFSSKNLMLMLRCFLLLEERIMKFFLISVL